MPRDKEFFKLRSNTEKQLVLTVSPAPPSSLPSLAHHPPAPADLCVERCFGLLVAHGRRVKHADMNLLEMVGHKVIALGWMGKETVSAKLRLNYFADCIALSGTDMILSDCS